MGFGQAPQLARSNLVLALNPDRLAGRAPDVSRDPVEFVRKLRRERDELERTLGDGFSASLRGWTLMPTGDGLSFVPHQAPGLMDPIDQLRVFNVVTRSIRRAARDIIRTNLPDLADLERRDEKGGKPRMGIFANPSSLLLASRSAAWLGVRAINPGTYFKWFNNGEYKFVNGAVNGSADRTPSSATHLRGMNAVIVHTPQPPTHDRDMFQLEQMCDVLRSARCASIRLFISPFPDERQDHQQKGGDFGEGRAAIESESLMLYCTRIGNIGFDEIVVMDFHPPHPEAFLRAMGNGKTRKVYGTYVLIEATKQKLGIGRELTNENCAVMAGDENREGYSGFVARKFDLTVANVIKRKDPVTSKILEQRVEATRFFPNVIVVDDIYDTGGTTDGLILTYAQRYAIQQSNRDGRVWKTVDVLRLDEAERLALAEHIHQEFPEFRANLMVSTGFLTHDAGARIERNPLIASVHITNNVRNGHSPVPVRLPVPICTRESGLLGEPRSKLGVFDVSPLVAEVLFCWHQQISGRTPSISRLTSSVLDPSGLPSFLMSPQTGTAHGEK